MAYKLDELCLPRGQLKITIAMTGSLLVLLLLVNPLAAVCGIGAAACLLAGPPGDTRAAPGGVAGLGCGMLGLVGVLAGLFTCIAAVALTAGLVQLCMAKVAGE